VVELGSEREKGGAEQFHSKFKVWSQTPETRFQFLRARPKKVLLLFSASFTFVSAKIHSTFIRARV